MAGWPTKALEWLYRNYSELVTASICGSCIPRSIIQTQSKVFDNSVGSALSIPSLIVHFTQYM